MTWGEFKKKLSAAGVEDDDVIQHLIVDPAPGYEDLNVDRWKTLDGATLVRAESE